MMIMAVHNQSIKSVRVNILISLPKTHLPASVVNYLILKLSSVGDWVIWLTYVFKWTSLHLICRNGHILRHSNILWRINLLNSSQKCWILVKWVDVARCIVNSQSTTAHSWMSCLHTSPSARFLAIKVGLHLDYGNLFVYVSTHRWCHIRSVHRVCWSSFLYSQVVLVLFITHIHTLNELLFSYSRFFCSIDGGQRFSLHLLVMKPNVLKLLLRVCTLLSKSGQER